MQGFEELSGGNRRLLTWITREGPEVYLLVGYRALVHTPTRIMSACVSSALCHVIPEDGDGEHLR